ncbi:MAG TPA: hypothetical protein VH062_31565 [Polyangiaceae bacterium]|jgi:hypothetical protein|nr:hypothetical protein [Polyangiaceae bacterium]
MSTDDTELELRERLGRVWRESAPANSDVVELRARLLRRGRRPRRSRRKMIAVGIVQGLMFGGATLAAAAWVAGIPMPVFGHRASVSVPAQVESAPRRSPAPVAGDVVVVPVPAGDVPTAAFDDQVAPAHHDEPKRARPQNSPAVAPSSVAATTENAAPAESAAPPENAAGGPWARVAEALSNKDYARAEQSLGELTVSTDPTTRDAAELARAELRIARGQGGSLRPDVERLSQTGATALIRRRAARLLERLP